MIHTKPLAFKTHHGNDSISHLAGFVTRLQNASTIVSGKVNPVLRMRGSQQAVDKVKKLKVSKAHDHNLKPGFF